MNHPRKKVEVALFLNLKWISHISDLGFSPCNRVAWVTLILNGSSFGVFSLYAPNDYKERILLWDWMTTLPSILWIVGGDFNMIESLGDNIGGTPFEWKGSKKYHWDRFKQNLHLFE